MYGSYVSYIFLGGDGIKVENYIYIYIYICLVCAVCFFLVISSLSWGIPANWVDVFQAIFSFGGFICNPVEPRKKGLVLSIALVL